MRAGRPPLHPGGAAVPLEEADRRRDPWRGGRRRARARRWCRTSASPARRRGSARNFTRLGFHPGFGLTETLPAVIGQQNAAMMFYTSRRVTGEEALADGPRRRAGAAGSGARRGAKARRRDRRERAARRHVETRATMRAGPRRPRDEAATEHELESRRACARPTTSRKASRRWPSAACRISRGGEMLR